ncbi:inner membrane protein YbjM [Enterobacter asburiae]
MISCFLLFTVVWLSRAFNVNGGLRAAGHPPLRGQFFSQPGAGANIFYPKGQGCS